jgi:hypothetical protein
MKTILKTVKNFIVGEPIPEKVLTLLLSKDQEAIDLAFVLLDLSVNDALKPETISNKKKRLVRRLKRQLKRKGFEIRYVVDDNLTYIAQLTIKPIEKFRPVAK